jgi:hypothetical protein
VPAAPPAPAEAALHALGRRWAAGEKITRLASEAGKTCFRLRDELEALGYRKGY